MSCTECIFFHLNDGKHVKLQKAMTRFFESNVTWRCAGFIGFRIRFEAKVVQLLELQLANEEASYNAWSLRSVPQLVEVSAGDSRAIDCEGWRCGQSFKHPDWLKLIRLQYARQAAGKFSLAFYNHSVLFSLIPVLALTEVVLVPKKNTVWASQLRSS